LVSSGPNIDILFTKAGGGGAGEKDKWRGGKGGR